MADHELTDEQIDDALEAWFANGPVGMEHKTDRARMLAAINAAFPSREARAYVDGDYASRELRWMPDMPSFDLPLGTRLYAAHVAVQEPKTALDSFIDDVEAAEKLSAEQFLPKLPDVGYLGDDVSYGYDSTDMRDYALEAVRAALAMKGDQPCPPHR